jgi:hypothetical protein
MNVFFSWQAVASRVTNQSLPSQLQPFTITSQRPSSRTCFTLQCSSSHHTTCSSRTPSIDKMSFLRILCFGDSLTEGYSRFGTIYTPYSTTMKKSLAVKFTAGGNPEVEERLIDVVTDGQSGDFITMGTFQGRIGRRCGFPCVLFPRDFFSSIRNATWIQNI